MESVVEDKLVLKDKWLLLLLLLLLVEARLLTDGLLEDELLTEWMSSSLSSADTWLFPSQSCRLLMILKFWRRRWFDVLFWSFFRFIRMDTVSTSIVNALFGNNVCRSILLIALENTDVLTANVDGRNEYGPQYRSCSNKRLLRSFVRRSRSTISLRSMCRVILTVKGICIGSISMFLGWQWLANQ